MAKLRWSYLRSRRILWPLLVSSLLSAVLLLLRMPGGHTTRYWFLLWNLVLAWFPLILAVLLSRYLAKHKWASFKGILLTILWLGFLPNSFYIISDFIHLKDTGEVSLLYDAVMFMSFAWNGLILGFMAVFIVHTELLKRLRQQLATRLIGLTFLLCSFAIYLGRYLAWNTWDILVNPAGILFDLSDRIIRPASYPNTFTTTTLFSVALIVMYYTAFQLVAAIRSERQGSN